MKSLVLGKRRLALWISILFTAIIYIGVRIVKTESSAPSSFAARELVLEDMLRDVELDHLESYLGSFYNVTDFKEAGRRQRHLFAIQDAMSECNQDFHLKAKLKSIIETAESRLYPWLSSNSTLDLIQTFHGRGIVMPVGSTHFRLAKQSIKVVRELGCSLPIQVMYMGDGDLNDNQLIELHSFENVTTIDITKLVDNEILRLSGWAIKPFCMLVSSFQKIILMDADAIFLQDPTLLFSDEGFLQNGSLFFKDRTLFAGVEWQPSWLQSFLPSPLTKALKSMRYFKKESSHEMDSAVVVMDKSKVFRGLLSVCYLNAFDQRNLLYKRIYGDKETFWIGFALVNIPFHFQESASAVIGVKRSSSAMDIDTSQQDIICGKVLHLDSNGAPLWWNGGLDLDKYTVEGRQSFQKVEGWSLEGEWEFSNSCIFDSQIEVLDKRIENLINNVYKDIWKEINKVTLI